MFPVCSHFPTLAAATEDDPVYKNTRALLLSNNNPYFFKGYAAEGIGSPHTLINKIWPIGITMRALPAQMIMKLFIA